MATLNIGGKRVKVDDAFLSLSPEQQQQTVEEIAKSIGVSGDGQQQPNGSAYNDALASASQASQSLNSEPGQDQPLPPVRSDLPGATAATISGIVNSIPVIGPLAQRASDNLMGIGAQLTGGDYDETVEGLRGRREQLAQANPAANIAGNVAGSVASLGAGAATKLGSEALGMSGPLLQRAINSGLSSQGLYTADQLARGNTGADSLGNGLPAIVGGSVPLAGVAAKGLGGKVADAVTDRAQNQLTDAAIKNAPSAQDLKAASSALFKQVDNSGVTVEPNKFTQFVANLVQQAQKDRINSTLDPKSVAAYRELINAVGDLKRGRPMTISDLHTLRQIAQKAAMSSEGRDAMFANRIVDGLDDFVTKSGSAVMPAGGKGAGGNELLQAISTWGRAKRVGMIEEAIYKAQNQASGVENGLRTQFRAILQNPKKRNLFTSAELREIGAVANGTTKSNIARLLGTFGIETGSGRNWLGAVGGATLGTALGGPVGGLLTAGAGTLARKTAEKMAVNGANRAAQVAATPNIPIAQQAPNLLAPLVKPLELTLRGGGLAVQR